MTIEMGRTVKSKVRIAAQAGILLLFFAWALFRSRNAAIDAPTWHLDGAFQVASGLFRLDAGQFPGRDFLPYMGVGPLLTLYPAFKAAGSHLSASVFSSYFMTSMFGALSTSVIWHFVWRPRSLLTSLSSGAAVFLAVFAGAGWFSLSLPEPLALAYVPGNSLRAVRSAVPYLVAAIYYLGVLKLERGSLRNIVNGTLTGALSLWSNDFAIPAAGLFALLVLIDLHVRNDRKWRGLSIYLAASLLSSIVLWALMTQGHPMALLKYNLQDVANDQWWFFGSYSEDARVFGPQHLLRLFSDETFLPLLVLCSAILGSIATRRIEYALLAWTGLVLFGGGALSSIGGHLEGYFGAFYFWGVMTLGIAAARLAAGAIRRLMKNDESESALELAVTAAMFLTCIAAAFPAWSVFTAQRASARGDANRLYVPELGAYLWRGWTDYIEAARQADGVRGIEEYWGVWSAVRRTFPPWPVDSVIHALGATRRTAQQQLQHADLVISTRNSLHPGWQTWSVSQNFWFYDELLQNWSPRALSPTTVVWRKNPAPRASASVQCSPERDRSMILANTKPGFYRVRMNYSFHSSGRHLVMVRNNMSFKADADGYVSIQPGGETVVFPAYIFEPGPTSLDIRIVGGSDYQLKIRSCSASEIAFDHEEVLQTPGMIVDSFFLTDQNWIHGVARRWAGFFVPNTPALSRQFAPGRLVTFANGDRRKIIRLLPAGQYLNVFLDGAPLDPDGVGLPSTFSVSDG